MKQIYEGKAKILYETEEPGIYVAYYKDDATAFNAQKRGQIQGKGVINCSITASLLQWLESLGIPTHYIDKPGEREMRVKAVEIIPLEVVVRNIAAGSLCKQTGLEEGTLLPYTLVEFYLKNDALGDPLLTIDRLGLLNLASETEINLLKNMALKINGHLQEFFTGCDITLVDFKLEFGRDKEGKIYLADEISPDTCRLWDNREKDTSARVLDKDRFRRDLGSVESAYQEVQERVLKQIAKLSNCS